MKKLNVLPFFVSLCAVVFFSASALAQRSYATFTVQLSGEGARLGRLALFHWPAGAPAPVSLGDCPFSIVSGQSTYPLLSSDQLSCSFTVPDGTFIMIEANASNLQASDRDWTVAFSSWSGFCTDKGHYLEGSQTYACEGIYSAGASADLTANFVTASGSPELPTPTPTVTPTVTPTMTPDPKMAEEYLKTESKDLGAALKKFNLKNFAKGSSMKLELGSAPATGQLSVLLTAKIKKAKANAAFMAAPASLLTLASAKVSLTQGAAANLLLRPTAKGKTYMKGKSSLQATLKMNFVPVGGGTPVSQIKNILMKRR